MTTDRFDIETTRQFDDAIEDTFRGDTELLRRSIAALLEFDAKGTIAPHGIGGHAYTLLSAAYVRLAALTAPTDHAALQAPVPAEVEELAKSAQDTLISLAKYDGNAPLPAWKAHSDAVEALCEHARALTTEREARLRAESERDALKLEAESNRLLAADIRDHREVLLGMTDDDFATICNLRAEIARLTAPATDEDVEQAAYRWFCREHDPEDWNDNWKADYVADLRAAIEALRG
jgi:hypothetical protein